MTTEYRAELYRDNEGREPDRYHLVEYQNGKMAGSAIGADTQDQMFAEKMAKVINDLLRERAWQPIEAAPRDGVLVLLFFPRTIPTLTTNEIRLGMWRDRRCPRGEDWGRAWFTPSGDELKREATHWMPLPTVPETAQ